MASAPALSTPVKVVLFLAGGVVVAGLTALGAGLLDPLLYGKPQQVAAAPEPAPTATAPEVAEPKVMENAEPTPAQVEAENSASDESGDSQSVAKDSRLPAFGLVRVEPNGSVVIAGSAPGQALVEAMDGDKAIGSDEAGGEGDFAIVFEEPLKPGDYEIRLRSTDGRGTVAMSSEAAIVSVPETIDGQVLALIERPGEASEIVVRPEPGKAAELVVPPLPAPAEEAPAAVEPAPAEAQQEATQPADVAATGPVAPVENTAPAAAASDPAPSVPEQPAGIAAAESGQPATATPDATATPQVVVEAVEIEGAKVFVAGAADPGFAVRVYANEIHLGDTRSTEQGRFLVEAVRELPVGDYIIRADLLGSSAEVLARAAVPFEREPGESIAAVAPGLATSETDAEEPAETVAAEPVPEATEQAETEMAADVPAVAGTADAPVASAPEDGQPEIVAAAPEQPDEGAATEPDANSGALVEALPPATEHVSPGAEQPAVATSEQPSSGEIVQPEQPAQSAAAEPSAPAADQPVEAAEAEPEKLLESEPQGELPVASAEPALTADGSTDVASAEPQGAAEAGTPDAEAKPAEIAPIETDQPSDVAAADASPEPVAVEPQPTEASPAEAPTPDDAIEAPVADVPAVGQEALAEQPAGVVETPAEVDIAEQPAAAQPPASAAEQPGVTQPKLQPVKRAVIIRKGDSLWKISRRAYGSGMRYSTLYLANQDQIKDPSRIWIGQVFTLPAESNEGESVDLEALGDQVTTQSE